MIQHIVLFKLKDEIQGEQKAALLSEIKYKFEALPDEIKELRALSVRRNRNPEEEYDFLLLAKLESKRDLTAYAEHPAHRNLRETLLKPNIDKRAAVDVWNELEIRGHSMNA